MAYLSKWSSPWFGFMGKFTLGTSFNQTLTLSGNEVNGVIPNNG
jgi:hypothetical protein